MESFGQPGAMRVAGFTMRFGSPSPPRAVGWRWREPGTKPADMRARAPQRTLRAMEDLSDQDRCPWEHGMGRGVRFRGIRLGGEGVCITRDGGALVANDCGPLASPGSEKSSRFLSSPNIEPYRVQGPTFNSHEFNHRNPSGRSHKDEFLACSVLLAQTPSSILRRSPPRRTYPIPRFWWWTSGAGSNPNSEISIITSFHGFGSDLFAFSGPAKIRSLRGCPGILSVAGNRGMVRLPGPNDTADWLGIDRDTMGKLNSPMSVTLLQSFAKRTETSPG